MSEYKERERSPEELEFLETLEGLGTGCSPNQLALELLKNAGYVQDLVVVARDLAGDCYILWTDQDLAGVAEASMLLTATVQRDLLTEHGSESDHDEDD